MNTRRVRSAAIGGALVLVLTASSPAVARSGEAAPMCPGHVGTSAGGSGMPGVHHGAMTVASESDYLVQMIGHHEEAVAAARNLERSAQPRMRELGASIVAAQTAEIEQMRAWLRLWYPSRTPAAGYEPMMRDLGALEGALLDAAFLVDMIRHHMTAVMMSQHLLGRQLATHDDVAAFAAQVRDDQRAEIGTMRELLDDLPDPAGGSTPRHRMGPR